MFGVFATLKQKGRYYMKDRSTGARLQNKDISKHIQTYYPENWFT